MAYWIRGGGEQTFGPSHGEGKKRPYYYVDDDTDDTVHRPLQRRAFGDEEDEDSHGQDSEAYDRRPQYQVQAIYRQHIPECDIPYQSIEPREDTPAETHVFFILHEESPTDARSFSSPSPLPTRDDSFPLRSGSLPARDRYSPLPARTIWKNGSDLKASSTALQKYYQPNPVPVHAPKPMRYEDWRDNNRLYASTLEQSEDARSFSPYEIIPRVPSRGQTPDDLAPRVYAHSMGDRWMARPGVQKLETQHHHEKDQPCQGHLHFERQDEQSMIQSVSCSIQDHDINKPTETLMTDADAAASVTAHLASFNRRFPSSRHERILLGLIHPKSVDAEFELDNSALESIFSSANEIFFNGRLTQRVQWDWSDANSNPQYDNKIIGHTSLRRAQIGGFETFVLLSTPILRSREYSRRLLISAFLHELIHCYLFICCGWSARESGGHTDGFRRIADTIDQWAGRENLFLCQVEADLDRFRQPPEWNAAPGDKAAVVDYSGYSLASPILYNARLCNPTTANTDWEHRLHDRWEHHEHHEHHCTAKNGHTDHTYPWP